MAKSVLSEANSAGLKDRQLFPLYASSTISENYLVSGI